MWAILLKVLSIIGIVLGCILGVVIVLLLLCLLCPIVYKIAGSAHEGKYYAKVRIHYLFGIIRAGFTYPEPGNIYAKAAWFTIYDSGRLFGGDDKTSEASEDTVDDRDETESDGNTSAYSNDNPKTQNDELEIIDLNETDLEESTDIGSDPVSEGSENKAGNTDASGTGSNNAAENAENGNKKKIYNPIYHIKKAWENFRYKVITRIKLLWKDISFYYKLLTHDDTKELLSKIKKHTIKILKKLVPKKGHANVVAGTGSPHTTAYIYGIYSIVMLKKANKYVFRPDFENKGLDGDIEVKGWFNLFGIMVEALPVVLSKKLRLTKARFDKHGDNMDIARRKAEKKHNKILNELEEEYSA